MCSPGAYQPNDAYQPGTGPSGFGGSTVPTADTSGGMIASQGQLPTTMKTPMGTVNNMQTIGKLSSNPQLFQQNQAVMGGLNRGLGSFNAARFIK